MDETSIYNSVPQTVWIAFVWSLVGAGIALCALWVVQGVTWCVMSLRRKKSPVVIPEWWAVESLRDEFSSTVPSARKSRKRRGKR